MVEYKRHPAVGLYCGRGRGRTHMLSGLKPGQDGWLGNPYDARIFGLDGCIAKFRDAFARMLAAGGEFRAAMNHVRECHRRGEVVTLVCWCQPGAPCHTSVIKGWIES